MDNPIKTYHLNGIIWYEEWYENNQHHRLNGPAEIWYYDTGIVSSETWYENNQHHRLNGPAEIYYHTDGKIESEDWYIKGNKIEQPYDNYPLTKEQQIEMKLKYG